MLILIVVAAAIALAAFVASYEKQVLAEESQSQQRALESLKILSVTPVLSASGSTVISSFSFFLVSEYINPSQVNSMSLNGQPLKAFSVLNVTDVGGTPVQYATPTPLILTPRDQVIVTVDLNPADTTFSLFDDSFVLTTSDYIEISLYTQLQNTFTQVFIPPTAVGFVTDLISYSSGSPTQVPLLDGTDSFQSGTNASIVQWGWTVEDTTNSTYFGCTGQPSVAAVTCVGAEAELSWLLLWPTGSSYSFVATLTVTDSNQLSGEASVPFSYSPP